MSPRNLELGTTLYHITVYDHNVMYATLKHLFLSYLKGMLLSKALTCMKIFLYLLNK